ncbi:MAG: hypothetical protein ACXAES_10855 [Promethearchaeota archaeon]|jgi:hypothetical protein
MPHFGLIDESLPEAEQYLMRARLHIKGGKIRLQRKEFSAGIAALYDAFIFSLYWFFLSNPLIKPLLFCEDGSYKNESLLYSILLNRKKIDGTFNFKKFSNIATKAIYSKLNKPPEKYLIGQFDHLMEELTITPYNTNLLPDEEAITL